MREKIPGLLALIARQEESDASGMPGCGHAKSDGVISANHTRLLDLDPVFEFVNAGQDLPQGWIAAKLRVLQELRSGVRALSQPILVLLNFLDPYKPLTLTRGAAASAPADTNSYGISGATATAIGAVSYPSMDARPTSLPGPLAVLSLITATPEELRNRADAQLSRLLAAELLTQARIADAERWASTIAEFR